jgi:retron-type reverse transcriptase
VSQDILKNLLKKYIHDEKLYRLFETVIDSFEKGLPLGNLTSQLFINVYLHELDHYIKHTVHAKYYLRYADDVVIVHHSPEHLKAIFVTVNDFLRNTLMLTTHKIQIRSLYSGVDVLGEVFFAKYKRLRRSTERRMRDRHTNRISLGLA